MDDSLEERIEDLEQLVCRMGERIEMLEQQLEAASRIAIDQATRRLKRDDEAA